MGEAAPRNPAGHIPARRPGSVRRTTTIETMWPDGFGQPMAMLGRGRDLLTGDDGDTRILDTAEVRILASSRREILSIATDRLDDRAQALVGVKAGGASRAALGAALGEARGTLLFQLVDDFAGASLVAPWAWSQWKPRSRDQMAMPGADNPAGRAGVMIGVCHGFTPGFSGLTPEGTPNMIDQNAAMVGDLVHPDDALSWHAMATPDGVAKRRARWLDLWRAGDVLHVDLGFQDSATTPDGGRAAIHEYRVTATIDPHTMVLTAIHADPRVLPYRECPGAVPKIAPMVGRAVAGFREEVQALLPGTLGCTHLNDVMRSMADVPALAAALDPA